MGGHQINPAGPPTTLPIAPERRKIAGQGHQLPGNQKQGTVPGDNHQGDGRGQQAIEQWQQAAILAESGQSTVANGIQAAEDWQEKGRKQEESAERVNCHVELPPGQEPIQPQASLGVSQQRLAASGAGR